MNCVSTTTKAFRQGNPNAQIQGGKWIQLEIYSWRNIIYVNVYTHVCTHLQSYHLLETTSIQNYTSQRFFLCFCMLLDVVCVLQSVFKEESMPKKLINKLRLHKLFPVKFYRAQSSLTANDRTKLAQFLVKDFVR